MFKPQHFWQSCVGIVTLIGALCLPQVAFGCACARLGSPCSAVGPGAAVFVGRVVAAEPVTDRAELLALDPRPGLDLSQVRLIRYRFQVFEKFAGVFESNTATVLTDAPDSGDDCVRSFEVGQEYLVYGGQTAAGIYDFACSRTQLLRYAANDIALLREQKRSAVRPRLWGHVVDERLRLDGSEEGSYVGKWSGLGGIRVTAQMGTKRFIGRTDRNGAFAFVGVPTGEYQVMVDLPENRVLSTTIDPVTVDACGGETFIFSKVTSLKGIIRFPETKSIDGETTVWVVPESSVPPASDAGTSTSVDANGAWEFVGLPPGRYRVGVNWFPAQNIRRLVHPQWYPGTDKASDATVIEVSDRRTTQLTIDFRQPAVRYVRGVVYEADGTRPADHVEVSLVEGDRDCPRVTGVKADESGQFTIPVVEGLRYYVSAFASAGEDWQPPWDWARRADGSIAAASGSQDVPADATAQVRLVLSKRYESLAELLAPPGISSAACRP